MKQKMAPVGCEAGRKGLWCGFGDREKKWTMGLCSPCSTYKSLTSLAAVIIVSLAKKHKCFIQNKTELIFKI